MLEARGLGGASRLFPGTAGTAYLNTAAEGLPPAGLAARLGEYAQAKARGSSGRLAMLAVEQSCRSKIVALMNVQEEEIALTSSASRAINTVIAAAGLTASGAIVMTDVEFPSMDLAGALLRSEGVEVRVVRSGTEGISPTSFAAALDRKVGLAAASLVSFKTGAMIDLPAFSAAARTAGVPLLIDATQALGVIPFDASLADFVVASGFKWLLGVHGVAVLYANAATGAGWLPRSVGWRSVRDMFAADRRERLDLWPDARRFEEGMPAFPALYGLDHGLAILAGFDQRQVADHVRCLGTRLIAGLEELGLGPLVLTPTEPLARAGIVSLADAAAEQHAQVLATLGVVVWGRELRLRASSHLYNGEADVDRLLEALADLDVTVCGAD